MTDPVAYVRRRWRERRDRRRQRRSVGHRVLGALADLEPAAFFVEVGAGDGVAGDHLRPFVVSGSWRGVMVEPVPYVFERLRRNYEGMERIALENAAIAERDGSVPIYHFAEADDEDSVPGYYHLLGSRSREFLLRHADIADAERRIRRLDSPAMTLETLLKKHAVERLDVLVVDTEGSDHEVVRQLDLDALRPRVVAYEDFHLSADDARACRGLLERAGYETIQESFDTWCVDVRPHDRLTARWRRIRAQGPAVSRAEIEEWEAAIHTTT